MTMTLSEKVQMVTEIMKQTKEQWVETGPEVTDLGIYLHFFRGDELVCTLQCPLDRDTALHAAVMAAPGFCASTMVMTFESYHTTRRKSPVTGEDWMPREMQYVAETNPDALAKEWVFECLTSSAHERGGKYALVSQPYVIKEGKVEWREMKSDFPTNEIGETTEGASGYMFENLQRAMSFPTILEALEEQARENPMAQMVANMIEDPDRRQFHIDMATAQTLESKELVEGVMLMAEEGSERQEWLRERLGDPDN